MEIESGQIFEITDGDWRGMIGYVVASYSPPLGSDPLVTLEIKVGDIFKRVQKRRSELKESSPLPPSTRVV